jgi:septal ring factor EnvC (AmiA/AmiB activator)
MARGAKRARALAACAAGALALLLGSAEAQTRRTAAQAESDRRAETQRAERLRAEAEAAQRESRALDARLREAQHRRSEAEAAALNARERLAAVDRQIAADAQARAGARDGLEASLIAAAFAERRIEPRAARSFIVARALGGAFHAEQQRRSAALAAAQVARAAVTEEQALLGEAQAAISAEQDGIAALLGRQRSQHTRLSAEAAAAERRARLLATEARSLRELAQRVQRPTRRGAAPAGPNVIPAAWVAPASGRIVRAYGARDPGAPAAQGATLATAPGATVASPASGEVAYAGAFRSYGLVLILNLDGGYAVVLTGLDAIRARVGDPVRAGQVVGQMSAAATPAPELYVEVRRGGQPVDPGRWLSARELTAEAGVRNG